MDDCRGLGVECPLCVVLECAGVHVLAGVGV